jgi:hypothetical protein
MIRFYMCFKTWTNTKLTILMKELQDNTTNVPAFHCMQEDNEDESLNDDELVFCKNVCDRQVWDDQPPKKMGLFHAFVRPHTKDSIDHRLYIVLSGSLPFLDEEFHRLWQDTNAYTTCEQLLQSEEIHWLRSATLRNHNRVAARLADALGLPVRCFIDTEDPTNQRRTAHIVPVHRPNCYIVPVHRPNCYVNASTWSYIVPIVNASTCRLLKTFQT